MTGSGFGDGWMPASTAISPADIDRLAVALVPLARGVALGGDPLGLARLLEQAPAFGQGDLGVGPAIACGRQRVAVALELRERQLALVERGLRLLDGAARRP